MNPVSQAVTHHEVIQALFQIQATLTRYIAPTAEHCGVKVEVLRYLVENEFVIVREKSTDEPDSRGESAQILKITPRGLSWIGSLS